MDQNTQQPPVPTPPPTDSGSHSSDHKPNMLTGIKESLMSSNLKMILSLGVVLIILLAIPISILTLRQQQSTRSSAAVVKLGDISNGTSLGNSGDLMQVALMTVPADKAGKVASGNIYVGGGGNSGRVYLIVYSNNNGTPGNLIAQSNLGTIAVYQPAGWVSFTFPTPFSVTSGQKIWVGRHSDGPSSTSSSTSYRDPKFYGVGIKQGDYDGVSSKTRAFGGASVPSPFGTATDSSAKSLSIYLTVDTSFANGLSTVSCVGAQINSTTSCSAIAPTNITASTVKFMIGTGTLSGSCIQLGEPSNGIQTISCTGVATGPTTGSQKIYYKIGDGTTIDSLATVQISAGTTITPTSTPTPITTITPTPTSTTGLTSTPVVTIPAATVAPGQASLIFSFSLPGIGSDSAKGQNNTPPSPKNVSIKISDIADNPVGGTISGYAKYQPTTGLYTTDPFPIPTTLTTGNYFVKARADGTLYKLFPGAPLLTAGVPNNFPNTAFVSGDINGDNFVDLQDYTIYLTCYGNGTSDCTVAYRALSDLNGDGLVSEKDLNILLKALLVVKGD